MTGFGRLRLSAAWILWHGRHLQDFETVEVESNHLLEILPAAVWHGVPVVTSVRAFPARVPTELRRRLFRYPQTMYAINTTLISWLESNVGRSDVWCVWVPALEGPADLRLADATAVQEVWFIGEIDRRKGQLEFLQAALPALGDGWRVRLLGTPGPDLEYVAEVERIACASPHRVLLDGEVENWQEAAAHRFVVAVNSASEGGPRVAVEALAMGVPVVMCSFLGSESFADAPLVTVVGDRSDWGRAIEAAHVHRISGDERERLRVFLRRYQRDVANDSVTAAWLGERTPAGHGGFGS